MPTPDTFRPVLKIDMRAKDSLTFAVSERQLMDAVIEMAERLGWTCYHTFDSRRSSPGFPDIVAVHPDHGVVWLELKTVKGRVRPEQQQWIDLLTLAGQRAYVARPTDMDFLESLFRGNEQEQVA